MNSFSGNSAASAPVSTFMCLWAIYIVPGSVYIFPPAEKADRSWEYINRSQMHECGNWDWDPDIPFLGIFVSKFRYFVFAVYWPAKLHKLAESIPLNHFLGSLDVYKFGICMLPSCLRKNVFLSCNFQYLLVCVSFAYYKCKQNKTIIRVSEFFWFFASWYYEEKSKSKKPEIMLIRYKNQRKLTGFNFFQILK
jgi:hypothetical protein